MKHLVATILALALLPVTMNAEKLMTDYRQNIRGTVLEKYTGQILPGASIIIAGSEPLIGTTSDLNGEFLLGDLPVGRYDLHITYIGFEDVYLANLLLNSGKEIVLKVEMEEKVVTAEEVTVIANEPKDQPLNSMAKVSARSFTIEETNRYAGSLGDPSRMVANYAGVATINDSRNDIIIRGNSPSGLLWRLEGITIPNPNHFGALGTTGGPVSMLNNNLLANSDFYTGAFPAQYGNALAGAFDLRMRPGNRYNHEFTGQIGFNGVELGAEGPFSKKYNGSFLINYRYSTLMFFEKVGIQSTAGSSTPDYQDLSFKIDLPIGKNQHLALFGIGGLSKIELNSDEKDSTEFSYGLSGTNTDFGSDMGVAGMHYTWYITPETRWKTFAAVSGSRNYTFIDSLTSATDPTTYPFLRSDFKEMGITAGTHVFHKFNAKNYLMAGMSWQYFDVNYIDSVWIFDDQAFRHRLNDTGTLSLFEAFVQDRHRFSEDFEMVSGVHFQYFGMNGQLVAEPRISLSYQVNDKSRFSLGSGMHSQVQPHNIYFYQTHLDNGEIILTNEDLRFTRSVHMVAGYDWLPVSNFRVKAETYYQYLYDAPVHTEYPQFSMLNAGDFFAIPLIDSLINDGTGKNIGLELTIEKFFSQGYYFLATASVYDSKYKGYDGVERNTSFNSNFVFNALGGYEFKLGEHNALTVSLKGVYAGGKRYIPIDVVQSVMDNTTVYDDEHAYEDRHQDYFKVDIRIGFRSNGKKVNQEWALDISNITNYENVFLQSWDPLTQSIHTDYQQGFFPMFLYRIQF